jgi:hypothetical protein
MNFILSMSNFEDHTTTTPFEDSSTFRSEAYKRRCVVPEDRRAPLSWASGLSLDYEELFFIEELGVGGTKAHRF